jgi:hypothetical protein
VDEAAREGLELAVEVLAADIVAASEEATAPAAGAVNHEVTVVMLHPAGAARDGTTLAAVVAAVDGPVADFWAEQSDGALRFGAVAGHDWTAQSTLTCAEPFKLWQEAATRAGWTEAPGRHLLVYVPTGSPGCAYGLGTIGTGPGSGGRAYVQATATSVIAHELGHNLGLGHASAWRCDAAVDAGTCAVDEYEDWYDVMGTSWDNVGSLVAPHAARLGLLPAAATADVVAGADTREHTLSPAGLRSGTRALRLTDADGDVYWLEYRTSTGRDRWLGTTADWRRLETGVLLRRASTGGHSSLLLDTSPSASTQWDTDSSVALRPDVPVTVGGAPFTVTLLGTTADGARVRVSARPATTTHTPMTTPTPVRTPTPTPTPPQALPVGNWEGLSVSGATLSLTGWVFDPDQPAVPSVLHVYVDGRGASVIAGRSRVDVARVFPVAGAAHGFEHSVTVAPGTHQVCVYAIDLDQPQRNNPFGCRTIITR